MVNLWKFLGQGGRILLISALIFSLVRSFLPVTLGWDAGVQMQAGCRLAQGLGLTTIVHAAPEQDLSKPPIVVPLSHWPPGYSLVLALLMKTGFNPEWSIKFICLASTLLGWLGWGFITASLLSDPAMVRVSRAPWLRWVLFLLPVLMTPSWRGTDIIVWAGIPYVILLLKRLIHDTPAGNSLALGLGLLLGGLYLFRYAAVFILAGTLLVILLSAVLRPHRQVPLWIGFLLGGFLVFWFPVHHFTTQALSLADLDSSQFTLKQLPHGLKVLWDNLPHSTLEFWAWLPNKCRALFLDSIIGKVLTLPLTLLILLSPFLLVTCWRSKVSENTCPYLLIFSSLVLADLSVIMLDTSLTGWAEVIRESRYYLPIHLPFWFLVGYAVLLRYASSMRGLDKASGSSTLTSRRLFFIFFGAALVVALTFGMFFSNQLPFKCQALTAWIQKTFQDNFGAEGLKTRKSVTQSAMLKLAQDHPEAVFYLGDYALLTYDLADPRDRFRPIPPAPLWSDFHSSQDLEVYWILGNQWNAQQQPIVTASGSSQEIEVVEKAVSFELIQEIPEEEVIIYRSHLQAGTHFSQ